MVGQGGPMVGQGGPMVGQGGPQLFLRAYARKMMGPPLEIGLIRACKHYGKLFEFVLLMQKHSCFNKSMNLYIIS